MSDNNSYPTIHLNFSKCGSSRTGGTVRTLLHKQCIAHLSAAVRSTRAVQLHQASRRGYRLCVCVRACVPLGATLPPPPLRVVGRGRTRRHYRPDDEGVTTLVLTAESTARLLVEHKSRDQYLKR